MTDLDDNIRHTWYVRRSGRVTGPFLSGHIQRELLLGHFRSSDQVSHDQHTWTALGSHPELVPKILKADSDDPLVRDRLAAARRWADDGDQPSGSLLSEQSDYDAEHPDFNHAGGSHDAHAALEEKLIQTRHDRWRNNIISLLILSVIAAAMYFYFSGTEPVSDEPVDCSILPVQGIDLSNCFLQGVSYAGMDISDAKLNNANLIGADLRGTRLNGSDLSYSVLSLAVAQGARLHGARMVGADFNGANLRDTDFSDADLSYANLYSADISGADLTGAKLDQAVWIDGRVCKGGSVGTCR